MNNKSASCTKHRNIECSHNIKDIYCEYVKYIME